MDKYNLSHISNKELVVAFYNLLQISDKSFCSLFYELPIPLDSIESMGSALRLYGQWTQTLIDGKPEFIIGMNLENEWSTLGEIEISDEDLISRCTDAMFKYIKSPIKN